MRSWTGECLTLFFVMSLLPAGMRALGTYHAPLFAPHVSLTSHSYLESCHFQQAQFSAEILARVSMQPVSSHTKAIRNIFETSSHLIASTTGQPIATSVARLSARWNNQAVPPLLAQGHDLAYSVDSKTCSMAGQGRRQSLIPYLCTMSRGLAKGAVNG